MKQQHIQRVLYTAAGLGLVSLIAQAKAQSIAVDGTLDAAYGAPLAVQTNNTQFGDNTDSSGVTASGSELDAAYGNISNGTLYLFLAGNLETNYNHLDIFIADGRTTGQSTLNTNGTLGAANGSMFSPGFKATYAIDINGGGGPTTEYVNTTDLTQTPGSTSYLGSFFPGTGTATNLSNALGTLSFSFNNSNTAGVVGGQSSASSTAAAAVTTGLEVAIPLSELGSPHGNIEVMADIAGGNDNYPSNQFLPGLPTIEPNLGSNTSTYSLASNPNGFNFSGVPNQFFTVQAPVATSINSAWLAAGNGSWSSSGNWSNGIPNSPADIAQFNSSNTAPAVVTLDGNHTVGQLSFNSTNSYNISQGTGGILTINDTGDAAGVNPLITVSSGSHVISAPVNLSNGVTVSVIGGSALTISSNLAGSGNITKTGGGNLDLYGSNTYTGNVTVLGGALEFDNSNAGSTGTVTLGDQTADQAFVSFNIGQAGLTVATPVVTNYDDSEADNQRAIAAIYPSGTSTLTGAITLNGGVVLSAPVGATLVLTGAIQNGTETNGNKPKYDLTVNGQSGTNGGTISLTAAETYTGLTIVNGGTLSLAPSASLATSAVNINSGGVFNYAAQNSGGIFTRTVSYPLNIGSGGQLTVSSATSHANRQFLVASNLSIAGNLGAWTGQLDLGNNDLDLTNANLVDVDDQLHQGFTGGTTPWTGEGIVSSAAANDPAHLTALGAIVNNTGDGSTKLYGAGTTLGSFDGSNPSASDILVKYTYFGDTNLDGKVDGSDYARVDNGYLSESSGNPLSGWFNGDFNYDGVIDGSDYTLIDNAFNQQGGALSALIASPLASATAQIASATPAGTAAVPEPTTLSALGIGAAGLLARRRRHR